MLFMRLLFLSCNISSAHCVRRRVYRLSNDAKTAPHYRTEHRPPSRKDDRENERERESPLPQLGCARRRRTAHVWQTNHADGMPAAKPQRRQREREPERERESPAAKPQRRQRERERAHCLTKASVRHPRAVPLIVPSTALPNRSNKRIERGGRGA